jgi:hypothetical protein
MGLFGENRCTEEDNIKTDLKFGGWERVDRTNLAQDRDICRVVVCMAMKLQASLSSQN